MATMAAANPRPDLHRSRAAGALRGTVALPGSKSISNRTLLLAALARGDTHRARPARRRRRRAHARRARDARHRRRARCRRRATIACAGRAAHSGQGGDARSRQRRHRVSTADRRARVRRRRLRTLGRRAHARAPDRRSRRCVARAGRRHPITSATPAFRRSRSARHRGDARGAPDRVTVRGDVSSQFTSALLMALPPIAARRARAITLDIDGELISKPYVAITTNLMRRFGVAVEQDGWRSFTVPAGARYREPRRHPGRRRRVDGVVLSGGRRARRRSGSCHRRGRAFDPGRRRVRRRARADGRGDRPRRRLDRGARRGRRTLRHRRSTASRFPTPR